MYERSRIQSLQKFRKVPAEINCYFPTSFQQSRTSPTIVIKTEDKRRPYWCYHTDNAKIRSEIQKRFALSTENERELDDFLSENSTEDEKENEESDEKSYERRQTRRSLSRSKEREKKQSLSPRQRSETQYSSPENIETREIKVDDLKDDEYLEYYQKEFNGGFKKGAYLEDQFVQKFPERLKNLFKREECPRTNPVTFVDFEPEEYESNLIRVRDVLNPKSAAQLDCYLADELYKLLENGRKVDMKQQHFDQKGIEEIAHQFEIRNPREFNARVALAKEQEETREQRDEEASIQAAIDLQIEEKQREQDMAEAALMRFLAQEREEEERQRRGRREIYGYGNYGGGGGGGGGDGGGNYGGGGGGGGGIEDRGGGITAREADAIFERELREAEGRSRETNAIEMRKHGQLRFK